MNATGLRLLREQRNLTRRQVAIATNLTEQTLYDIETNKNSNPTASTLEALADYFNCSVDMLMGRS